MERLFLAGWARSSQTDTQLDDCASKGSLGANMKTPHSALVAGIRAPTLPGANGKGRIAHRFLILPLLFVASFLPMARADAATSPAITVSTTAHGIKLTLVVPSRIFPANALVRFTVRVHNVSHHTVLTLLGPQCLDNSPSIEVLDDSGNVTSQFPPKADMPPCPIPRGEPLLGGKSVTQQVLAIVNGASVRAVLPVGRRRLAQQVVTPKVAVGGAESVPRTVAIHQLNGNPFAVVTRPATAHGPLYVKDSTYCGAATGGASLSANLTWHRVKGDRVYSGCAGPQQWHGFAGYLNSPVVSIDYSAS